jgi:hypothetical protein
MRRNLIMIGGIVASLILLGIVGCGGPGFESADGDSRYLEAPREPVEVGVEGEVEVPAAQPSPYESSDLAYAAERLIIRSGSISMIVEDTRATLATIEGMVAGMGSEGAFVVSADEYGGAEGSQPSITISIRIPATRFDDTMDRLAELAVSVSSRSESAQDVTEEYVDLEARLETLEAARQRLLDIMAEARTTEDLLEAEQQLTQREAEIESIKGRMQYLEQSARLSSIWIELQPYILSQPVANQWRPIETARRAVEALVDVARGFGDFLIFFAIAVLPWLLAIGVVIFLIVRFIRGRTRARRADVPASDGPLGSSDRNTPLPPDREGH